MAKKEDKQDPPVNEDVPIGEIMAKELIKQTKKEVSLKSINDDHADPVIPAGELLWMQRIVWASQ